MFAAECVAFTHIIGTDAEVDVAAELAFEGLVVLFLQGAHVIGNVLTEDMGTVHFSVEGFLLGRVAWEAFHGVRDVESTIDGSFHGTEDSGAGCGTCQTNVQEATESARAIIGWLDVVLLTCATGT